MTYPPPGWYQDPYGKAPWRWWDGQQWGIPSAPPARDAQSDVAKVRPWARWTKRAIWAFPAALVVQTISIGVFYDPAIHSFSAIFSSRSLASDPEPMTSLFGFYELSSFVVSGLWVIAMVPMFVWFYRTVIAAKTLGLQPPMSPVWSVLGWFVPVVHLWFPYLFARNSVPPDSPIRTQVRWWWATSVTGTVLGILAFVVLEFNVAAALTVSGLIVLLAVGFAYLTVRLVDAIAAEHDALLSR